MTITDIALSKLEPSPINVRKTGGTSIDDLAASIEAHGLIQTLTVRAGSKDKFEVVAGGRRLAALNRLAKEKRSANGEAVTRAFPVPCRVLTDEDATEISLAENAIRQAMHPADQFDAFKALADGGMPVTDIAARFGVSERTVEQRLKLSRVSPKLLAAYRVGEMTLEQLEAFTVTDDVKRQENVWKAVAKTYQPHPMSIRRMLTDTKVSANSQKVALIGLDAYLAAGGTVTRDLFAERDSTYLNDPELVDRLVGERLEAEAESVKAEGWGWVRVFPEQFNAWQEGFRTVGVPKRPLTVEEEHTRAGLMMRRDTVEADAEAREDGWTEEQEAEFEKLGEEILAIDLTDRSDWSAFDKASAGAAVSFDWSGKLTITRGLVSRDGSGSSDDMVPIATMPLTGHGSAAKPKAEFTAALLADLSAQRTMAMRAEMASNPGVALDALVYTLAVREFFHGMASQCAKISATNHFPGGRDLAESKAALRVGERRSFWVLRLPHETADLWQWVREADEGTKLSLLAYLVATSLDATQINGSPATENSNAIHAALGLDMVNYFGPFMDDCLARMNRTQVLEAVEEAVSPEAARALNGAKKAELVAGAEKALAGTGWLPKPLRQPELPVVANENAADEQEAA